MKGLILTTIALGLCGYTIRPDFNRSQPVRLRIIADKERPPRSHARDETALAWGLSPRIFRAVEIAESSGGLYLKKYEPKLAARLRRRRGFEVAALADGWTIKQLATSYGPMHVLGLNYRAKGFSPADVDDHQLNYNLAAGYLIGCHSKTGTWRGALLCYNGGGDLRYPVRVAKIMIGLGVKSKNG